MKMYMVGGYCRDEILGVKSKDIDFSVVFENGDMYKGDLADPFRFMSLVLQYQGFEIFLETPEFLTIRARFPKGHVNERLTADFVLARKEGEYTDGRRPDVVTLGTLLDDLSRRDFTMNAVAKDEDGSYIDPFDGQIDIANKVIRAVGDPVERLSEDALRAIRALRFSVTKGFDIHRDLRIAMDSLAIANLVRYKISDERIDVELSKMFRFDTVGSLYALTRYPLLTDAIFSGSVSLDSTMKLRGRG